jgi:uncharacterized protein (UPF0332 family)
MRELFLQRSAQNLEAAELLFDAGLYDASANRSYYAVFDAAFVACLHFGAPVVPDHAKVLSLFCGELVARQKIYPASLKNDLYEVQRLRVQADYKNIAVTKSKAQQSIKLTKAILTIIVGKIQP